MLLAIAGFEVRQRLQRVSTYVYFAVFLALAAFFILAAGGAIPNATVDFGTGGKVDINSPYSLAMLMTLIASFTVVITAAIAGRATHQDIDANTTPLLFTRPISRAQYLGGRFLGALSVILVLSLAIGLGTWLATWLPWMPASRLGPQRLVAYVVPYLLVVIPDMLLMASVFFALAVLTRRMLPVYVGAIVALLGYFIGVNLAGDVERRTLAALVDPFGLLAVDSVTHYWSIAEKNTRLLALQGDFLWNRLLWIAVAVSLFAFTYRRFSFSVPSAPAARGAGEVPEEHRRRATVPGARLAFSARASRGVFAALVGLQLRETVKSVFFGVIVLAGVLFIASTAPAIGKLYGTPTYPVTRQVLTVVGGSFATFILVVLTLYAGELVWRERDAGMAQIYDALPTPRWAVVAAKLTALVAIVALLLLVVVVAGVTIQAAKGFFHFELGLYLRSLYGISFVLFACLCSLAVLVHVLIDQKYVGHFAMVVFLVVTLLLPVLGVEHHLLRYATVPAHPYSDMNGYGHFVAPMAWFELYWVAVALALAVVAYLFWVRGTPQTLRERWREARARLDRRAGAVLGVALAVAAGAGTYIFWNTNLRNTYRTRFSREEAQAQYEKRYKQRLGALPLPKVTAVKTRVDIFPAERRVEIDGVDTLTNRTDQPIDQIVVRLHPRATVRAIDFPGGQETLVSDGETGVHAYRLRQPLAPGATTELAFRLTYANPGFENEGSDTRIVENGTFIDGEYLPGLGYFAQKELTDNETRRKHGLGPRERALDLDDPSAPANNYITHDADRIQFEATVSTSADQRVVAPGTLEREWTEGGRRYFHFVEPRPIFHYLAFLSARYVVEHDRWNDVALEIAHHPDHTYDVPSMRRGMKDSLEYFTRVFGPYQHPVLRIVEFPGYATFAESFSSTVPFSEAIGFVAEVEKGRPDAIDYPLYVTAHEVAHHWWGHQVLSADSQGMTALVETLAQYSALMVMKHAYGPPVMRRFLRYELDRYLSGRSAERMKELPLLRVEDQGYIHYSKGSLVMYALQDLIGEDAVNLALRELVQQYGDRGAPYPTSRALLAALRRHTPERFQYYLTDQFEQITLYENRAVSAKASKRGDGKYEVTLELETRKVQADALGAEREVPVHDWIPVGVLDAKGEALALETRQLDGAHSTVTLVTDRLPARAGVDPLNELIDRIPEDNLMRVTVAP
ncbi:MAG TPA: ABC transporter permease [Myxococcaceae bacterium]|nr:ABC transporter permease [Myxococcaceae bacterium]